MGKKSVRLSIFLFTLSLVFSVGFWFVVTSQAINPPPAPPLGIPSNGATDVSENPFFDWDGVGNTDGYWIFLTPASADTWYWYQKDPTFSSASWNNGSGWSAYGGAPNPPSTLSFDTKYIWAVVAYNSAGQTSSSVWQFTVRSPAAPTPTPTPKPKPTPIPTPGATPSPSATPPPPSPDDIISIAGMLNNPTDLTAKLTDTNSVELCWNDTSTDETHWFVVHNRPLPGGGNDWHTDPEDSVLGIRFHHQRTSTTGPSTRIVCAFTEDDLSDGTHYFWVGGYNNDTDRWSDWSNLAELTISAPPPPVSHTDPSGWPTTGEIRNWYPDLGGHPCDYDYCQNYRDVDIHNELGTPIYATMDGTVFYFGGPNDPLCGIGIIIQNDTNYVYYCHLDTQSVPHGSQVTFRTQVATMGKTGNAGSPHVHYGIQRPAPPYPFEPYWGARIDDLDDTDPN